MTTPQQPYGAASTSPPGSGTIPVIDYIGTPITVPIGTGTHARLADLERRVARLEKRLEQ